MNAKLPIPDFYDPAKVVDLRFIDYAGLAAAATTWRDQHQLQAVSRDGARVGLLAIDMQNTFCHPEGELFVGGRSGDGAVQDCRRTAGFIYRNMGSLTELTFTLDTHRAYAIFHPTFMVDADGNHPAPFTEVALEDVITHGDTPPKWQVTPQLCSALGLPNLVAVQRHLQHYCQALQDRGRYKLTIWPFHGMMGGPGHAVVSGLEEAAFFHSIARGAQTRFEIKGGNPLTENYSVLGPEVTTGANGKPIDQKNTKFIQHLLELDLLIMVGEAWSHCFNWTADDLLEEILAKDASLARKVVILKDCTSAVTVPDGKGGFLVDYTPQAEQGFQRFEAAGMKLLTSDVSVDEMLNLL